MKKRSYSKKRLSSSTSTFFRLRVDIIEDSKVVYQNGEMFDCFHGLVSGVSTKSKTYRFDDQNYFHMITSKPNE